MKYTQCGARTATGPTDWFTGTVHIDGIRNRDSQSAVGPSTSPTSGYAADRSRYGALPDGTPCQLRLMGVTGSA